MLMPVTCMENTVVLNTTTVRIPRMTARTKVTRGFRPMVNLRSQLTFGLPSELTVKPQGQTPQPPKSCGSTSGTQAPTEEVKAWNESVRASAAFAAVFGKIERFAK